MSSQITVAFVRQFNANVTMLYQQQGSKLRGSIREESLTGEDATFERIGPTAAVKRTTRHGDTPLVDTPHSRRLVSPFDFEWGDLVDQQDKIRMLISPESSYAKNAAWALGRSYDDEVIAAFNGIAHAGKNGETDVAFPAAQVIANGNVGMTLDKWRVAKRMLDDADVPEDERYVVISPRALEQLLSDTQLTSADFNTVKAMVNGEVDFFLGMKVLKSTRLPLDADDIRSCFAWHLDSMGIKVGKDITTRIDERIDKSYAVQVYACMTMGATRIQEEGVVQIDIDETPD